MKKEICAWVLSGMVVSTAGGFLENCEAITINNLTVVASNSSTPTAAAADVPMGQGPETASLLPEDAEIGVDDFFGLRGGYIHPYLNIQGAFTDNLYNVNSDETDNFLTRVSPGIWLSLPRKKEIPVALAPHNTSPGGLQNQLKDQDSTDRYMLYILGGLDLKYYSENSDLNDTQGIAEGLFRYNMAGGLSLQVLDRYSVAEDTFGFETINRENQARFDSNLFKATADWEMTEKLRFEVDYTNFFLDYDESIDSFKDRSDNGVDLYGYYNFSIKTAIFLQYRYLVAAYDTESQFDSDQHFYYGGVKWNTTEKVALLFKAGHQEKEFDNDNFDGFSGLALDLQLAYRYSEKTNMDFSLYRTNEETDSTQASDKTVMGLNFGYNQQFNDKISGVFSARYEDADYSQFTGGERDEQTWRFSPGVQYLFREWLRGDLTYMYEEVDSTQEIFEYKTNTVFVNLNFAI